MEKREIPWVIALSSALSAWCYVYSLHSNFSSGPSAEEITAQKEAEKEAALAPFVGVWENKSVWVDQEGRDSLSIQQQATFQAAFSLTSMTALD